MYMHLYSFILYLQWHRILGWPIIQYYLSAIVFIYLFLPSAPPLRGVLYTYGEEYSPCLPNIPLKFFSFRLKSTVKCSGHSCMYQLCHFCWHFCIHVWAPITTLAYYFEGFPLWWHHRYTPMMSLGVGIPSSTVISFGTNSNTPLFIWFNPYSETFSAFSYMYHFSYWLDK